MSAKERKQKLVSRLFALVLLLGIFLAGSCLLKFSQERLSAEKGQLEQSLKRAAAACYGAEGVYPASLEDLLKKCPLGIDFDRYAVHYEIFASNLMPEITVLEKNHE